MESSDGTTVILVKLHGSVRWGRRSLGEIAGKPNDVIVELPHFVGRNPGKHLHAVLYPSESPKPTAAEPFRTGYRIFRHCLNHARILIVIGCSLRDPEVRSAISDAADDNPHLRLLLFGPEAKHDATAVDLGIDAGRVAAVRGRFETTDYVEGKSAFMGCLRGYSASACADEGDPVKQSFRFGVTRDYLTPDVPDIRRPEPLGRP